MARSGNNYKHPYDGKIFDSEEEKFFWIWCKEAYNHGFISGVTFHPETFILAEAAKVYVRKQLKTKAKIEEKSLLQEVTYTTDFLINITPKMCKFDHRLFTFDQSTVWIDIKPEYSVYNDEAKFSVIRKWMLAKHGIYINKILVNSFFEKTWVPLQVARKKNGGIRNAFLHCRNVFQTKQLPENYPLPEIVPAPEEAPDLFDQTQSQDWEII